MLTVPLPNGMTAVLRDKPEEIRVRQQQLIQAAGLAAQSAMSKTAQAAHLTGDETAEVAEKILEATPLPSMSFDEAASLLTFQNAIVIALLVSWTLPEPLPTMDTLPDIDPAVYGAIADAARPLTSLVTKSLNFDPGPPSEAGPTTNSSPSAITSRVGEGSPSTTASSNGGVSSATGSSIPV